MTTSAPRSTYGSMRVARSRGALSGLLLVLLGLWGAAVPFFGPYADYAYTPDAALTWTAGRFWLEVLPGVAALVGGLVLLLTSNRAVGVAGGYLASAAGAWFVVGPVLGQLWAGPEGAAGTPVGGTTARVVEQLGFFSGLGAVVLFTGAQALGRFTVRGVRDARAAERHEEERRREQALQDVRREQQPARADGAPAADGTGRAVAPGTRGTRRGATRGATRDA